MIQPPAWSMALGQIGAGLVLAGSLLFLVTVVAALLGRTRMLRWTFPLGCLAILGAMGTLVWLFQTDQFQFKYVAEHSWRDLSAWYKIAAVWSGQQGSFLLWACTSAVFGLLAFARTGPFQRWFVFTYAIFLGTLCGILAYETPFGILPQVATMGVPHDGLGLTPSLQNYWVVIHPPTIFTGFGSLIVLFAFAVSAMITGDAKSWLPRVRPWALVSLAVLGLGLVMGGLWAYETQGWGGFWAWDPVENVSFVPWLFTAAFIHGCIVQTTRSRWHGTNLFLAGLPFLLFVYGTFLTRSGFLSKFSVHSFAEMNRSALWILMGFMGLMMIGFVTLWIMRGRKLGKASDIAQKQEGFNRERAYESGVLLLTGLSTAIAIGMSVPFFIGLTGGSGKVVEEPLYHMVVVWFFIPILLLMGGAPFLAWRRMGAREFWGRVVNVLGLTIGIVGVMMMVLKFSDWNANAAALGQIDFPAGIKVDRFSWVMCLFGVTAFAAVANIWRLVEMFPRTKAGIGGFLAHLGVAIALAGLILSRGLEQKSQVLIADGMPGSGLGYVVSYKGMSSNPESDRNNKLELNIESATTKFVARPGFYFVPSENGSEQAFSWPSIRHTATHDFYLSLGQPELSLWEQPVKIKPGETVKVPLVSDPGEPERSLDVTYIEPTMHGKAAQEGTSFGAKLRISEGGQVYDAEPTLTIGHGFTLQPKLVRATPAFYAYIEGLDANDRSITLQMPYVHPIFPLELYYKPMTGLVWLGTGILTLGGLLSAFYRRSRKTPPPASAARAPAAEDAPSRTPVEVI